MFAGNVGILRPANSAHRAELLYRLGVLYELGKNLKPPLLVESAAVTVAGLAAWLKGWCPCAATWKPGSVKQIASARADAAAGTRVGGEGQGNGSKRRRAPSPPPPAAAAARPRTIPDATGRTMPDATNAMMGEQLPPGEQNPLAPHTGTVQAVADAQRAMPQHVNLASRAFRERRLETIVRMGATSRITATSSEEERVFKDHCLAVVFLLDAMQENASRWGMQPALPPPVDATAATMVAAIGSGASAAGASGGGSAAVRVPSVGAGAAAGAAGAAAGAAGAAAAAAAPAAHPAAPSVDDMARAAMERSEMQRSIADWAAIHMALSLDPGASGNEKELRKRRSDRIAGHLQGENAAKVQEWRQRCQRVCACLRAGLEGGLGGVEVLRGIASEYWVGLTPSR
jgi:hypothetical protein